MTKMRRYIKRHLLGALLNTFVGTICFAIAWNLAEITAQSRGYFAVGWEVCALAVAAVAWVWLKQSDKKHKTKK